MYNWYKILTYLFYPFTNIFLFIRKIKKKEHINRYKEKLSKIEKHRGDGVLIWFHAASVGECMSILPLIQDLEANPKINKILITSITLSSEKILHDKFSQNSKVIHQFLPLDIPVFVKHFLNHWSPNLAIFVDSEIWPNLIFKIKDKKIPLMLINGRITKKSFLKWKFINSFAKEIFQKFDLCIAASKESENYLKILGAKNVKNYGNLKFSETKLKDNSKLNTVFLDEIKNRKIWCAASTHFSEELFCGKVHLNLKKNYKNILTIIIPRHVNRIDKIKKQLIDLDLKVLLYSNINQINNKTDILIVDAYGKASGFFKLTKSVFLGGSLIKHGGQNPIEASRLGCKILHGPNISNFKEIYDLLKFLTVSYEVNNENDLYQCLMTTFKDKNIDDVETINKINNYGITVFNNVMKEIKAYINI
jgi:3-deoxy-D-manno-octulosonic-acid transferase